jgi:hypothetical protein
LQDALPEGIMDQLHGSALRPRLMFLYSEQPENEEDVQYEILEQYRELHEDMKEEYWVAPVPPCERKMRKIRVCPSVPPAMPTQVLITRVDDALLRQKTPVFALCCADADDRVKQTLCHLGSHQTIVCGGCDLVTGCISRELYPYLDDPENWLKACQSAMLSAGQRSSEMEMLTDIVCERPPTMEAPDDQMLLEAFDYPPIHTLDFPMYMDDM